MKDASEDLYGPDYPIGHEETFPEECAGCPCCSEDGCHPGGDADCAAVTDGCPCQGMPWWR